MAEMGPSAWQSPGLPAETRIPSLSGDSLVYSFFVSVVNVAVCPHFLTRYDENLREPLVHCQVNQVSMRVKRGRVSWLSSHGRD